MGLEVLFLSDFYLSESLDFFLFADGCRSLGFVVLSFHLGGGYMRKLALVRVSYQDDFFILYHVLTGSFHILLFEGMYTSIC